MAERFAFVAAGLVLFSALGGHSLAAGAEGNPHQTVILDTAGYWRIHETLKPPVARTEGGLKTLLVKAPWVDRQTPDPPADWMKPDFDDHRWMRAPLRLTSATPYLARLCLRGKFTVTDPAKVRGLRLSATYHCSGVLGPMLPRCL